jgi:hypothetical protein
MPPQPTSTSCSTPCPSTALSPNHGPAIPAQPTTQQQPAPCLDDQQQSQRVSRPALIVIADTDRHTVYPEPEHPLKLNCPFQCCGLRVD